MPGDAFGPGIETVGEQAGHGPEQAAAARDATVRSGYQARATDGQAAPEQQQSVARWPYEEPPSPAQAERLLALARTRYRTALGFVVAGDVPGDEEVLRAVVSEISARAALDEVLPRLSPETEALIDELLPSWRSSAA